MAIKFITGNENKFLEVSSIVSDVEQLDIDLPEIQEIDSKKVIHAKLEEALKHATGPLFVEDVSLHLECLNGLPGPLFKWFFKAIGNEGVFNLADKFGNYKATATLIYGLAQSGGDIYYFEHSIEGVIVQPRGHSGFGWDPIFMDQESGKTFAEMKDDNPNQVSPLRVYALQKLKSFLEK